jgi:hypothetical protein
MRLERRLQAFDDTRRGLLDEMEALNPALLVARPIAGPLTVSQAVRMGQVLVDRHVRQIRALQRLLA